MSAATIIAQAFGEGACLYADVLEVDKDATSAQLRKAYYRKALQFHPDKTQGKEIQFQAVNVAYEILKDADKRAEYDETGEFMEEEGDETSMEAWKSYFSQVFGKITTSDIDKFAATYKCSSQEQEDVLKTYTKFKGNVTKMLTCVMLSEARDAQRWVDDYIQPAIDEGTVEDYSKTLQKTLKQALKQAKKDEQVDADETESDESDEPPPAKKKKTKQVKKKKKLSKREKEAQAADELMAKIQGKNALAKRKAGFDSMFAGIQERYGVTEPDPLGDDDFEAIQAEMLRKKRAKK